MNSTQLALFLNQIRGWPQTRNELDDLAEKIAMPLGACFSVITSDGGPLGWGLSPGAADPDQAKSISRQALADFLMNSLVKPGESSNPFKRIRIEEDAFPWPCFQEVRHLSAVSFNASSKEAALIVGTQDPLPPQDEAALVAISQRLTDLAKIRSLESELQTRNQFLSIASHELKTPLTSIYGILQLQERMLQVTPGKAEFPDQERHHSFLKMVIRQVERLNELIDGLLDVSRIQNGRFMVEPTETDVALLLQDTAQTRLNLIAEEGGVKLKVDTAPKLIARVDPVRMEEVISNLVMNAIRLSPEGGVIWIRLKNEEDCFRLTVRDQGPSIPIEDRERIFQPFERPRMSRLGGLGLGLFISRQIAQLHGGNVSLVESLPGKGNVFEAYFPSRNP